MHKYIIMGVQGCGKGTQAQMLVKAYDMVHINVGEIFRWNIEHRTKLGARIQRIVARGELVDDETVDEIVKHRLDEHNWNYGFVLDGFPRNEPQAMFFLESYDIDAVIHINVPDEVVVQRIMGRRFCSQCGLDYNIIQTWPKEHNRCDVCGGRLVKRQDDTQESIERRLQDYHNKTRPLLDLLGRNIPLVDVDGARAPEEIQVEIRCQLGLPEPPAQGTA